MNFAGARKDNVIPSQMYYADGDAFCFPDYFSRGLASTNFFETFPQDVLITPDDVFFAQSQRSFSDDRLQIIDALSQFGDLGKVLEVGKDSAYGLCSVMNVVAHCCTEDTRVHCHCSAKWLPEIVSMDNFTEISTVVSVNSLHLKSAEYNHTLMLQMRAACVNFMVVVPRRLLPHQYDPFNTMILEFDRVETYFTLDNYHVIYLWRCPFVKTLCDVVPVTSHYVVDVCKADGLVPSLCLNGGESLVDETAAILIAFDYAGRVLVCHDSYPDYVPGSGLCDAVSVSNVVGGVSGTFCSPLLSEIAVEGKSLKEALFDGFERHYLPGTADGMEYEGRFEIGNKAAPLLVFSVRLNYTPEQYDQYDIERLSPTNVLAPALSICLCALSHKYNFNDLDQWVIRRSEIAHRRLRGEDVEERPELWNQSFRSFCFSLGYCRNHTFTPPVVNLATCDVFDLQPEGMTYLTVSFPHALLYPRKVIVKFGSKVVGWALRCWGKPGLIYQFFRFPPGLSLAHALDRPYMANLLGLAVDCPLIFEECPSWALIVAWYAWVSGEFDKY
jgi:hypothetical protein